MEAAMDLNLPENRHGLIALAQFIRPELKSRVLDLAAEVESLAALRQHPTFREFVALSTMTNDLYPPLPQKYKARG